MHNVVCTGRGHVIAKRGLPLYRVFSCLAIVGRIGIVRATFTVTGRRSGYFSSKKVLAAMPPSSGGVATGPYLDVGDGHWIESHSDDGSVVTLEDGSKWAILNVDQIDVMLWLPLDDITVTENGIGAPYSYRLVNTDERGETADARFLGFG